MNQTHSYKLLTDAHIRGRGSRSSNSSDGDLTLGPVLASIAEHAPTTDETRTVPDVVIDAIKANPIMSFTASENIGGLNRTTVDTGLELEAVAARCASTAWVLWNHLCTFHLFAGLLGPDHASQLRKIVQSGEWVCFPAGASTGVSGTVEGDQILLHGKGAFGSGARYADHAGVSFVMDEPTKPRFSLVKLVQNNVRIDADWYAMSLRGSATDSVYYEGARISTDTVAPFPMMYRVAFRDPDRPMLHARYREDWVALSDLWLGLMAVGLVQASLDDVSFGIRERVAIMGVQVAQRPLVQVNLGQAQANINAARDTVLGALVQTDQRIASQEIPTEGDYLRQLAASVVALQLCNDALTLLQRVMGGNGLREGVAFERRLRDFQAMPLHINAHQDRVNEQVGRNLLGLESENPF
ncbi:MAG: acyl-CoA dehydrogenase family protein [Pseudomonadota bacterium]